MVDKSLRDAVLESTDISDEDALAAVIEFPLTEQERIRIRNRVRGAADNLEKWAAEAWDRHGENLTTEARMAIVRQIDQAQRLRAQADALMELG